MTSIKKFIDIVSENTSGAVATVAMPMGQTIKREQTEESKPEDPKVLEYGMWENSAISTSDKLKKKRGETKVVKSVYGESEEVKKKTNKISEYPLRRGNPVDLIPKGVGGGGSTGGGAAPKVVTSTPPRSSAETQQAYAQAAQAAKAAQSGSTAPTSTAPVSTATTTTAANPVPSSPPATVNSVMRNARTGQPSLPRPPSNVPQYTLNPQYNKTQSLDISPRDVSGGRSITPPTSNLPGAGKIAATTAGTTAATTAGMMAANAPDSKTQPASTQGASSSPSAQSINTTSTSGTPAASTTNAIVSKPTASTPQSPVKTQQFSKGVQDIATANKIANPNLIKTGQTLKLPDGGSYTVQKGDTLSKIASMSKPVTTSSPVNSIPADATSVDENEKLRKKEVLAMESIFAHLDKTSYLTESERKKLDEGVIDFLASSGALVNNWVDFIIDKMVKEAKETMTILKVISLARNKQPIDPELYQEAKSQVGDIMWAAFTAAFAFMGATAAGATGGLSAGLATATGVVTKTYLVQKIKDWIKANGLDALLKLAALSGKDILGIVSRKLQASGKLASKKAKSAYNTLTTQSDTEKMIPPGQLGMAETKSKVKEDTLEETDLILNPASISKLSRDLVSKEHDRRDHEVGMALSDLYQAGKNAATVFALLKNVSEEEGIEGWVQEKIIKAADYLNTIREYLEGRQMGIGEGENKRIKGGDPCWKGYEMIGKKKKNGREVPNCVPVDEDGKPGLWANIHAKRERIKSGSGERMRKPGSKSAPSAQNFRDAAKTSK